MNARAFVQAGCLAVCVVAGCATTPTNPSPERPPAHPFPGTAPGEIPAAELDSLVDRLAKQGKGDPEKPWPRSNYVFLGWDIYSESIRDDQVPEGLLWKSERLVGDAAGALAAQGSAAIPVLLDHLEDARPSVFDPLQGSSLMWSEWQGFLDTNGMTEEEYPEFLQDGVDPCERHNQSSHHFTVGDACFVILGQILNREFQAARYQPSAGAVYCSPSCCTAIARLLRLRWKDMTRERYRQHLIQDIEHPDNDSRAVSALVRLAYFFPDDLPGQTTGLLRQPVLDSSLVREFTEAILLPEPDASRWQPLVNEFVGAQGEEYREFLLDHLESLAVFEFQRKKFKGDQRAASILDALRPGWRETPAHHEKARSTNDLGDLVQSLISLPSAESDAAIQELLANVELVARAESSRVYLAHCCLAYLEARTPGAWEPQRGSWKERADRLPKKKGVQVQGPLVPEAAPK